MNIVFAAGLLACGACSGMYAAMLPVFAKMTTQAQAQAQAAQNKQVKDALESLAEEEKALDALPEAEQNDATAKKKAEIAERRKETEESLKRPMIMPAMDLGKMGLDDPKFVGWMVADVVTGLILNVLMLVSGVALVRFKPSGLTLGFWVAVLKIARLLVLWVFFILAVVPTLSRGYARFVVDMLQQQQGVTGKPLPPGVSIDQMTRIYTIAYSVMGVAIIVLGVIYPLVCLWLFTRPGARAACLASKKLEERGEAW
ncbi:MAG: hypothetical protein P4L84_15765 [Isosphaeraceae bacterium]|nr:hypothetical protein [Isosphaeraceae bacterium]